MELVETVEKQQLRWEAPAARAPGHRRRALARKAVVWPTVLTCRLRAKLRVRAERSGRSPQPPASTTILGYRLMAPVLPRESRTTTE
jgi:hypothetical protein